MNSSMSVVELAQNLEKNGFASIQIDGLTENGSPVAAFVGVGEQARNVRPVLTAFSLSSPEDLELQYLLQSVVALYGSEWRPRLVEMMAALEEEARC